MIKRQDTNEPVHTWEYPVQSEGGSWVNKYSYVRQVMSKELYTVQDEDQVDLATSVMDWRKIHHVPVENEQGEVVGIISSADVLKYYTKRVEGDEKELTVSDIMTKNPTTVHPDTFTVDALKIMRKNNLGCLPIVNGKKLIGIITEFDFVCMAEHLFEELQNIEAKNNHII
jgi:CBS domain-containing protein